jgi:hypothetical protein
MITETYEGDKRLNITATNTALKAGSLLGILVASSSSGTLKVADGDGTICNTMSVAGGTFYRMPCRFRGTLTVTVGGTLDATIFYKL